MGTARYDWRYAVAGLGWGAAVGILTGSIVALASALDPAPRGEPGGLDGGLMLIALPAYGAVYGVLPGAVVGLIAGVATTMTTSGVTDPQRAWRSAFVTTWVVGAIVGLALSFWVSALTYPMAWWSVGRSTSARWPMWTTLVGRPFQGRIQTWPCSHRVSIIPKADTRGCYESETRSGARPGSASGRVSRKAHPPGMLRTSMRPS